ncbi:MAG: questin oxidase family protein [Gammaproteobacteria bacterium]|nr:questin oxidase family protein [Gammaproteobacteria bacterium]MYK48433.1 questin oxidase family protein [Gammaproteobacteria bacterium]
MTAQDVRCPDWLATQLLAHRDQHGPHYQGFLSDHLPMAMLAMHALGARRTQLEAYADSYKVRLDAPVQHATEAPNTYAEAIGDLSSYGALLGYFDREIATQGLRATLNRFLPALISGWVRFAFHPVIRLAYGIRFGVESEVAAGLAYLTCAGPDDALLALAKTARRRNELAFPEPVMTVDGEPFEQRYKVTVASGALTSRVAVVPDNRRVLAETGLALFNATRDFFALHVVTGTHALGVCADAIGLDVDGLLSAGVLAAYLTIGAPRFEPQAKPTPTHIDDEHDAKMAFSCLEQARRLRSRRFEEAAAVYTPG